MSGKFSLDVVKNNVENAFSVIDNMARLSGRSGESVTLLAATKTVDAKTINFAINECGVRCIGENRVQEFLEKYDDIDKENVDIHFIGRLQTNKVKYICDKVSMIHSVDSEKLAKEIDRQCKKIGKVMKVLVEVNIGGEDSKGGIAPNELEEFLKTISAYENIKVVGLMCIPPICEITDFDAENEQNTEYGKKIYKNNEFFEKTLQLFLDISQKKLDNIYMQELSMGMSDDFDAAVKCGSTIVRIGRGIFGSRN